MTKTERLATNVEEETKRHFRVAAAQRDMDMSELLRELVDEFLEEERDEGNQVAAAVTTD